MAIIFLLGPSLWEPAAAPKGYNPMEMRRRIAETFRKDGHKVVLMEDEPDRDGEDLVDKFDRLLREHGVTDIVVYWPAHAKMQTTYDELILLRDRAHEKLPCIWIVHHVSVASIKQGKFEVKERGGRSRYLTAVARLGVDAREWDSDEELDERIRLLSAQL